MILEDGKDISGELLRCRKCSWKKNIDHFEIVGDSTIIRACYDCRLSHKEVSTFTYLYVYVKLFINIISFF